MGSRVRERQDEEVALNLVEQHPIVFDLAVAKSGEVACERVVAVLWRKRLAPGEKIDNMPMSSKKSSASALRASSMRIVSVVVIAFSFFLNKTESIVRQIWCIVNALVFSGSDGENELEAVFQEHFAALPNVTRVLDAMHACQYVDTMCKDLEKNPERAAKASRRLTRASSLAPVGL